MLQEHFSMRPLSVIRLPCALPFLVLLSTWHGLAQTSRIECFPANKATGVNPDTHLVLTFASSPTLGKSGQIRIYDAADHSLTDTLDLSIPAGPDPTHRITSPSAQAIDPNPSTPTTTTPAVRTVPAVLHNYQLTAIGGLADFHFYPVIIHGNVATIYLHNNVLRYNHKYIVRIDSNTLTPANGVFAGFATDRAWTFSTKSGPPAANTTVSL
jgi:pectinesterase